MIYSIGLILFFGFIGGLIVSKIKIPKIVGMILAGILFGPYVLNLINIDLLNISSELRMISLVIILTRSGLSIDFNQIKKMGVPAVLLMFVPALFEILGVVIFGPILLNINLIEAFLLGSVLAAVSPAIVVPSMIKIKNEGYGNNKGVSDVVLAGSSLDDIFVIIMFYFFLGINQSEEFNGLMLLDLPISIITGIAIGLLVGFLFTFYLSTREKYSTVDLLVLLSVSFLLIGFEELISTYVAYSSLISILVIGLITLIKNKPKAAELEKGYKKIWLFFEIILFVLVGASLPITTSLSFGVMPFVLIIIGLIFRSFGVMVSLLMSKFNLKERLFIIISYLPKATVQSAIGPIPLALGLASGNLIITSAVLSVLLTAPVGAFLIDLTYKKLLITNNKLINEE